MSHLSAFIAGISEANSGPAGIGVVVSADAPAGASIRIAKYVGKQLNHIAEYVALLEALQVALQLKATSLHVASSSGFVVRRIRDQIYVRDPRFYSLDWICRKLAKSIGFSIAFVPRKENVEAIRLATKAIEAKKRELPVEEPNSGTRLYTLTPETVPPALRIEVASVNEEVIRHLSRHPEQMHDLSPRMFEELVAELFHDKGFETVLTPRTRDGGLDIKAIRKDSVGTLLYVVECKRYAPERPVSVEVVRSLFGVASAQNASCGIVATTSRFTREAQEFASRLQYRMSLRGYDDLVAWLGQYSSKGN